MQNLPEEVIHKINDFRIGDHEYWKNEYNKIITEIKTTRKGSARKYYCNKENYDFIDQNFRWRWKMWVIERGYKNGPKNIFLNDN